MLRKICFLICALALTITSTAFAAQRGLYFYGDGCHYCELIKPWFDKFTKEHEITVDRYEVFNNKDNYNLLLGILQKHGFKAEDLGTPTFVLDGKIMIGAQQIIEGLEGRTLEEIIASAPKVHAIYYYGEDCYFCKQLEPWIKEVEKQYGAVLIIDKYEVFNNKENNRAFNEMMKLHKIKKEDMGTPTLVINNKVFIGEPDIKKGFEKEFPKALEAAAKDETPEPVEVKAEMPDVSAILLAAAADSINPCAMMVLIILLASLLAYHKNNLIHVAAVVTSFIAAVFITYFILGLGVVNLITSAQIANQISTAVGILAIVIGLMNFKDAFFYRAGGFAIEIPEAWKNRVTKLVTGATSPIGAFAAGAIVTMFELPCTGGPYLFGLSLIAAQASFVERIMYLGLYNIIFISPLVAIALLCTRGIVALETAEKFKNDHIRAFRIITGAIMTIGGIWLAFLR